MGAAHSAESTANDKLLYQEAQNGKHDAVNALRLNGASLEWVDKERRTPLIVACTRGNSLDMAITLLNLGANINAYTPGQDGGTPLHHATNRGLEKTVTLLLSRGANPLTINDGGQTCFQIARGKGHTSILRILEEHVCLFSGMLREISGFRIWGVTEKIWVVVLPTESASRRKAPAYELVVYQSIKVSTPRTRISLAKAKIKKPKFNRRDPVLHITDKTAKKTKYKFRSGNEGDKAQLERLYKACRGVPQVSVATASGETGNLSQISAAVGTVLQESAGTATPVLQRFSAHVYGPPEQLMGPTEASEPINDYTGWAPASDDQAGPDQSNPSNHQPIRASLVQPSAPPLPAEAPIYYPSLDMIPASLGPQTPDSNTPTSDEKTDGSCVICWDAPAQAACVPCGHLAGCMDCLSELKAKNSGCPLCREQIQHVVKIYAAGLIPF